MGIPESIVVGHKLEHQYLTNYILIFVFACEPSTHAWDSLTLVSYFELSPWILGVLTYEENFLFPLEHCANTIRTQVKDMSLHWCKSCCPTSQVVKGRVIHLTDFTGVLSTYFALSIILDISLSSLLSFLSLFFME